MKKSTQWIGLIIIYMIILTACGTAQQADISDQGAGLYKYAFCAKGTCPY